MTAGDDLTHIGPVRVGGQALPDGVLMRTDRAWAIARLDGTVVVGDLRPQRLRRVPVLRVVTGLGPALLLGLRGGRGRAGAPAPKMPWPLVRGLAIAQLVVFASDWVASSLHLFAGASVAYGLGVFMVALVAFRMVTPAAQWRLHGAEHKAVTAHERGVPLGETAAVLSCPRVHLRCGTNLVVWVAFVALWLHRLPWAAQLVATVAALAVVAELMAVAARHQTTLVARVVLAPGAFLQRWITTSEPTLAEQAVGCRALSACLDRHSIVATAPSGAMRVPRQ